MSKKNNNVDDIRNWGMESTPSTTKKKTKISSSSKVVPLNNNQKKQRSPHLREAFNMIDKDNSGYILTKPHSIDYILNVSFSEGFSALITNGACSILIV